jgi:DsbC/DsbD-like thiol-disulfide interchange protein
LACDGALLYRQSNAFQGTHRVHHKLLHWLVVGAGLCLCVPFSLAQIKKTDGWTDFPNVSIRLTSGPELAGGKRALIIDLKLAAGWKTYWRMPGDAGIPPTFDWQGSVNLSAAEVLYPAPIAMSDQGGTAIGYKGDVSFPVVVTPQDKTAAIGLALEFGLGVCKDICIPVEAKLTGDLQPGGTAKNERWSQAISRVPIIHDLRASQTSDPALIAVSGKAGGAAPLLAFETRGAVDVFVEVPEGMYVPLAKRTTQDKFIVDLSKTTGIKDLIGKSLRLTIVGPKSAIETNWTWKE